MLIYQLLFPNGKSYIGKTIDPTPARRILEHKKSKYAVGNAIRKYGLENVKVNIIEDGITDPAELNEREIFYIKKLQSLKNENGYNIQLGGNGGNFISALTTEEKESMTTKKKESLKKTIKNMTKTERKEKYGHSGESNGMYGKKHTPETIQLLTEISSNYIPTPEQKQKHLDIKKKHRGENSWNTKYSRDEWIKIYDEVKTYTLTQKKLAEKYGVSVRTIENLSARRHWCFRVD